MAAQKTKKGEPLFADLKCLETAAELKGFEIVHTSQYNWYNRHVGDYPVPPGMNVAELGNNALFILRMKEPKRTEMIKKHGCTPYDVGVLADPNNPGCYTIIYDFFAGGYGVDELLGGPVYEGNRENISLLCPLLKQTYDMVCDSAAAQEAGDSITFMTLKDARQKLPYLFDQEPATDIDEQTWISIADTDKRIGVR